jgi:hypothetical protein
MVLLGLSLGTLGIFAAPTHSRVHRPAKTAGWNGVHLFDALWRRIAGWTKEGPGIDPLGTKEGPRIDPLGSPSPSNGTQTQNVDSGCGIEPWGQCLPGH